MNYRDKTHDFNSRGIWHASLIGIENRPFLYTFWLKAGVKEARVLLNQDQTFLSYNAFVAKYNIKTNYLEYSKVMAALKQFKKVSLPELAHLQITQRAFCHTQILTKSLTNALCKTKLLYHYRAKKNGSLRRT